MNPALTPAQPVNRFRPVLLTLALLALSLFASSWPVAAFVGRDAVLAQRVIPQVAGADLFGDSSPGTPVGSPQMLIIRDPRAFIGPPEQSPRLVNENFLRENHIYPLQLKTVEFFRNLIAAVSGAGFVLLAGLLTLLRRQT